MLFHYDLESCPLTAGRMQNDDHPLEFSLMIKGAISVKVFVLNLKHPYLATTACLQKRENEK
jgi:uncharacterized protein (DUF983 family)